MPANIEAILSPGEFISLGSRDLGSTVCVVFDILRATSSIVTALGNGATGVFPVAEISEALSIRKANSAVLLAGERDGLRIESSQTGEKPFDLGNSPREFTREKVAGKAIAITTTNGTRALKACSCAKIVLAASFLNLAAVVRFLQAHRPQNIILVCSGTFEEVAYEDVLAAGALAAALRTGPNEFHLSDAARICINTHQASGGDLGNALAQSRNGRRLASRPELAPDVSFCAQRDIYDLVTAMGADGWMRGSGL